MRMGGTSSFPGFNQPDQPDQSLLRKRDGKTGGIGLTKQTLIRDVGKGGLIRIIIRRDDMSHKSDHFATSSLLSLSLI
jgi:hypothetical protein